MMTQLLAIIGAVVVAKVVAEHYKDYNDLKSYKKHHQDARGEQAK